VNTWKVILATMVIFGAGVVTGGLLVRHSERVGFARPARASTQLRQVGQLPPGVLRLEFLRRAHRDLDLTPEQREKVDRLIKESQEYTREIMEPVAPLLQQELMRTRGLFVDILTPVQRVRFEAMMKEQQQHKNEARKSGPPREHGPASPVSTNLP
jgi:hypothetical protein